MSLWPFKKKPKSNEVHSRGRMVHRVVTCTPITLCCRDSTGSLEGTFEDDGETGYFYALDFNAEGDQPIVEACMIYQHVKPGPMLIEIVWAEDRRKVWLLADSVVKAAFDFDLKRCWGREGFPVGAWGPKDWSPEALDGLPER